MLIAGLLSGMSSGPARAGCALSDPIPSALAENNEQYAQICGLGWQGSHSIEPCPMPAEPTIDVARTHAEGTVATALVPYDYAQKVRWELAAGSSYTVLYQHESTEAFDAGDLPAGAPVTFGAPGLTPGTTNHVRVAFQDNHGEWTCWSPWHTFGTPAYTDLDPDPPAGMAIRVEDLFDRPDTAPRCADSSVLGDGIGPDAVWYAYSLNSSLLCPELHDRSARFFQATGGRYQGEKARSSNLSWSEAEVRVEIAPSVESIANFQVETKVTEPVFYDCETVNATVVRAYWAKLAWGPRLCEQPTLFLVRSPEQYGIATCTDTDGDGTNDTPVTAGQGQFKVCDGSGPGAMRPPLDQEDPDHPGRSYPVWARITANDPGTEDRVILQAWIAWNCADADGDGTVDIDTECDTCTHQWTDFVDQANGACQPILDTPGRWGMGFHERTYFVETFRAGDDGPAGP
ncbi:MAG: hypothetical protein Kow0062_28890 [Acidobacteriota bacterium]